MKRAMLAATAAVLLVLLSACDPADQATTVTDDSGLPALPHDAHSYAQPEKARVTNVSLDLTPDFATKKITGTARLAITRAQGADSVILDTRDLAIRSVKDAKGVPLGFALGAGTGKDFMGVPLAVALPATDRKSTRLNSSHGY